MAGIMGKCLPGTANSPKTRVPDGCGGKTIIMAAQFGYDRQGFDGYPGIVG